MGIPPDTEYFPSETGSINGSLFLQWMKFFVCHIRRTAKNKALLILDNHESHRCVSVLYFASENHVNLLSVPPPHYTHKFQPCDVPIYS